MYHYLQQIVTGPSKYQIVRKGSQFKQLSLFVLFVIVNISCMIESLLEKIADKEFDWKILTLNLGIIMADDPRKEISIFSMEKIHLSILVAKNFLIACQVCS